MTKWRRGWDKEVCKFVVIDMAACLQIASVGEYCDDKEDFESYTERLSAWLVVNGVTDEQKSSVFLAVIGASTLYWPQRNPTPEHLTSWSIFSSGIISHSR